MIADGGRGVLSKKRNRAARWGAARFPKKIPAMTYFRTCGHYHRPRELNGRVRNGNECDLTRKVTGKQPPVTVKRPEVDSIEFENVVVRRFASKRLPRHSAKSQRRLFQTLINTAATSNVISAN